MFAADKCPTLTNMLVIIVGGIPIAMPTVLSVTLALGAFKLAKEGAIVARMSAVEEMAGQSMYSCLEHFCCIYTAQLALLPVEIAPVLSEHASVYLHKRIACIPIVSMLNILSGTCFAALC